MNRLNHEEIAEIARLVARRGIRAQGMGPTSGEVGAVLGLSPSEVEAMLHELRLKNGGAPLANPSVERRTVFLALGSVAALLIVAALALLRGSLLGGAASAPVASVPGASASPNVLSAAYPTEPSAPSTRTMTPLAQNASETSPTGLAPQIQDPGEARALTSGSEVRRAVDSAGRTWTSRRYAVTQ